MINIKQIRSHISDVKAALDRRGDPTDILDKIQDLDAQRLKLVQQLDEAREKRNRMSRDIGQASPEDRERLKETVRGIKTEIQTTEEQLRQTDSTITEKLSHIPNLPHPETPDGKTEDDNPVIKTWGNKPDFEFSPLPHWDWGEQYGQIDFERGVRLSGSRFYTLKGDLARFQRGLIAFLLDQHVQNGYQEIALPYVVKQDTVYASGQLPKFADNLYQDHQDDVWLVPTAEVPLTSLHADEILATLPLRYCAHTPCFRREKMSAGRDVRGIKRGHQFDKVEMYTFCEPQHSDQHLKEMLAQAEGLCQQLGLPYQVKQLCAGDLGFSATQTYDIEVWAAGCQEWLEVSSISNCQDFQARRAKIRYRVDDENRLVHTLNGSGLGIPRTMIALIENNQLENGAIRVPDILVPYVGTNELKPG